jgi:gamma-glutamyltranspeptidase / glutathione hydrolase
MKAKRHVLVANAMAKNGGLITFWDLKSYKVIEREPLEGDYKGYEIITSPPPSLEAWAFWKCWRCFTIPGYDATTAGSAASYYYLAEVMRRFYADRNELGDREFVENPVAKLLDSGYIAARRRSIAPVFWQSIQGSCRSSA